MTESGVLAVLSCLRGAGLTTWVDGGWGVDALLGETTREHSDLDLVVLLPEIDAVRAALAGAGYRTELRDRLPTAVALADGDRREVDLHPLRPSADGGGDQALPDGTSFHYPAPVDGTIAGQRVRCVDADTQVLCHLGYPHSVKDRADLRRLAERFGAALPDGLLDTGESVRAWPPTTSGTWSGNGRTR